jgi:transcriptional regulator with XRE-family HTH domain
MPEPSTIGRNLKRLRNERDLSQEALADLAGVNTSTVARLEQGRRRGERTSTLMSLANALDVELSDLCGKRERLGTDRDGGSVLAIRDAILTPSILPGLPGLDVDDPGEPTPLPQLDAAISNAWEDYWGGDFGALTAAVPGLIGEARLTHHTLGPRAAGYLAQAYQLAACLCVHFGKTDLAAISAERGITVATTGNDELQWAAVQGTYAWVLEYQGRLRESEDLSLQVARQIEPNFSAPDAHLVVWGNMLISAIDAAAMRKAPVDEYVSMAAAGAERIGRTISAYRTTFGATKVAVNEIHAHALNDAPGQAMAAAKRVVTSDLPLIARGHHLLDMAQVHLDARQPRAAERQLLGARELSPVWFRHQGAARNLVAEVREKLTRPSPVIRKLARDVGLD